MVDLRTSLYGWALFSYPLKEREPARAASFRDGRWTIEQASGDPVTWQFGQPGDIPVPADWDGDGLLTPGVYRPSTNRWIVGRKPDSQPAMVFALGGMRPGDLPLAGDWTGAHHAGPGYYRPADASWHLFVAGETGKEAVPVFYFGEANAVPLAGDWDGRGHARPAFYQPATGLVFLIDSFRGGPAQIHYLLPRGEPVVVNWTGMGEDTVNTIQNGKWSRHFANCDCLTANPAAEFSPKLPAGRMFAGRWRIAHAD